MKSRRPASLSLYCLRIDRLSKLLDLGAPPRIVVADCWLVIRAYYGGFWRAVLEQSWFNLKCRWPWPKLRDAETGIGGDFGENVLRGVTDTPGRARK